MTLGYRADTNIRHKPLSFDNWQHRYKQQKPSQVRFLSESQHTIKKMSDNLNMTSTIAGKAESVDLKTITLRKEQLKLIFLIYFSV